MERKNHWAKGYDLNAVKIALSDEDYVASKLSNSKVENNVRNIYELFLSNLCFLVSSFDGFCDPEEELEYVSKCNFAQKSLYAEFPFIFKEVKEGKLEALISITLFEKVCDRLTLDHSISQKMKLNELARKVFKANIGYTEFKKELLEASKVTLVSKEENLGTLSSIQKQLSSQDIDDIDPRDVYEMAGIEVLNVFDKKEIKTVLGKLRAKGLLKEDAISNFKKNILNKSKNSNFSKIPMKTRNEILQLVEEI
jgi:hypothetical protein